MPDGSDTVAVARRTVRAWAQAAVTLWALSMLIGCSGGHEAAPVDGDSDKGGDTVDGQAAPIDLSHWRLTIPADQDGGVTGPAAIIETARLIGSPPYSAPWFYRDAADGALRFWVPVDGAISGTSSHPRSELREMLDPDDPSINWSASGQSRLQARVSVEQVPKVSRRVFIGQVHAYRSAGPLMLLDYQHDPVRGTGKVVAIIYPTPTSSASARQRYTLATDLPLSKPFDYRIGVDGGVLSVEVNARAISYRIGPAWDGASHYFKAGAYILDEDGDADDGARVAFYRLEVFHD